MKPVSLNEVIKTNIVSQRKIILDDSSFRHDLPSIHRREEVLGLGG